MSQEVERVYPMELSVVNKYYVAKDLLRVTLTGERLSEFPNQCNGAHIKVFFPNVESGILQLPIREGRTVIWPEHKPVARAYTVREYRRQQLELDIDFVDHGDGSVASRWARHAQVGDTLGLVGPGGPDPLLAPADWHFLAGDLTALPAISAILEMLPASAKGEVFIEVDDLDNQHPLTHPKHINIHWLEREKGVGETSPLYLALNSVKPPHGLSMSAFIAGENNTVVACRNLLKSRFALSRKEMYAIPYWCRGKNEEAYHHDRHEVMDEEY